MNWYENFIQEVNNMAKKICLCSWCIQGIRSHGEKLFVGDEISEDENPKCEMCDETETEIYEVYWEV